MDLINIYHDNIPSFISRLAGTEPILRLRGIGMNCGMQFTNFPTYNVCNKYSKFEHSIGVALIVWHFTKSEEQAVAALLHDISTPAFAHTIDFMNGDYETQESTEDLTATFIMESDEIKAILNDYGIKIESILNYHDYSIADNDSPKISADRLEYTICNLMNFGFIDKEEAEEFYNNILVGINEYNEQELVFRSEKIAISFANLALKNSHMYVSDPSRASKEFLSELLKKAINFDIIKKEDLYRSEFFIIEKLLSDERTKNYWTNFRKFSLTTRSKDYSEHFSFIVNDKKRWIDPFISGVGRVSSINEEFQKNANSFINMPFDYFISLETWEVFDSL